ncbi:transmembrane protein 221 [Molothrus ater]|uniref:transmembrane protein 221 n=1 Tax=Molothrus ater TaxID=84834 RepID=UPI001747FDC6|nr:transmembrane protein 221 [Molothrus ater]
MPSAYPQRALTVLLLFGTLSAAMALLSSSLIFQLPSGRAAPGAGGGRGALPEPVAAAVLPVSAVLAALCLVLNVSCLLLCLLHGYCSTELGRGRPGPERAVWFLLDSRSIRHAAIGLFCCGVCLYLTALALLMLLLFEPQAGIASACVLTSGILVLLLSLLHALLRASRAAQISRGPEPPQALHENGSAQPGHGSDLGRDGAAAPRRRPGETPREFCFPPFLEGRSRPGSASSSNPSSRSKELLRESQWELSRSKELPRESHQELSRSKEVPRESQDWSRSKELPRESQELSRSKEFPRECQDWSWIKDFPRESQWELSRIQDSPKQCQDWSRIQDSPRQCQAWSRIQDSPRQCQAQAWSRTHRTLLDSGLLQEQGNPWNVTSGETRNAVSHRATKDSTLV